MREGQILSVSNGGKHRRKEPWVCVCARVCVDNPEETTAVEEWETEGY